jgi:hypothetical protein
MAVHAIDIEALEWLTPDDSWPGKVGPDEPQVQYKPFETTAKQVPRGQLVYYEPGHHEAEHSHPESEFLYFMEGDVAVGDLRVGAGTLLYIEGSTVYGPITAGAKGAKFLRLHLED